ncbi:MAG: DUF1641 domain-containing protein [Sandaracinaceae bacterium]
MEAQPTAQPSSAASAPSPDVLARIDARLARIEASLRRYDAIAEQAPAFVAAATDAFDEAATLAGRPDERMRRAASLLERLSRPETLDALETLVDALEAAPGLVATAVDAVDELAAEAARQGVGLEALFEQLLRTMQGLTRFATSPEVQEFLGSDMMSEGALATLSEAARSLAAARAETERRVGVLGAIGALRDPEVQRAVGFAVTFAKGFGRVFGEERSRRLEAGRHE